MGATNSDFQHQRWPSTGMELVKLLGVFAIAVGLLVVVAAL